VTTDDARWADVAGLRTLYRQQGSGYPVVLVHGQGAISSASTVWGANIAGLAAAGLSVYAPDQPGFGETDNAPDFTIEGRIEHLKAFIDLLGLRRFALCGSSDGSYIACRLALEDPRVERVVLIASGVLAPRGSPEQEEASRPFFQELRAYTPTSDNARAILAKMMFDTDRITDDLVDEVLTTSVGKNLVAHRARTAAPPPRPILDDLGGLRIPALILWGLQDRGVGVERGLALLRAMPTAEMHVFGGASHWLQRDRPERVNQLVADFVSPHGG
jgi:pimeloyl-ACP methyl ester carboxylesterase